MRLFWHNMGTVITGTMCLGVFVSVMSVMLFSGCAEEDSYEKDREITKAKAKAFKEKILKEVGEAPTDGHLGPYEQIYKINGTDKEFNYQMKWNDQFNEPMSPPIILIYKTQSVPTAESDFVHYSLERPVKGNDGMLALTDIFEGNQYLVVPYVRISLARVSPQPLSGPSSHIKAEWDEYMKAIVKWRAACDKLRSGNGDKNNRVSGYYFETDVIYKLEGRSHPLY